MQKCHGVPEGAEKKDMIAFVTDFLNTSLELRKEVNIRLERGGQLIGSEEEPAVKPIED